MKIGVLSDTHIPDAYPELPVRVLEALRGMDIILHAGDICSLDVLHQLEPIAQTFAVYGDEDPVTVRKYLQDKQRLSFCDRAVGLIHGAHAWDADYLTRLAYRLSASRRQQALYRSVASAFSDVDAVVFGHSKLPYIKMHGGVLLFNPGSIVARSGRPGTIGILDINRNAITGRLVSL